MNADHLRKLEAIFSAAMELPGAGRASFVAEQCGGDAGLRAEVESLLAHASASVGMLDVPPVAAPIGATFHHGPVSVEGSLPADRRIGSYLVLKFLGAGGMGVVYLAEQDRPRRTVALKLIRGAMASPSLLRRFEHEAEILGRMHHAGIAQIYEAGVAETGQGPQPFLAMELVEGPPITDFAEARRLGTRERLELIARVCDAVHHAHQRGVIHRDLKPSNILVDAHAQPKILDFGVARAIDADLQVTTLRTSVGQLIGTLPYMSPEQIAADPAEIDNRADVYALGVLSFELLAGKLPFDLRSRSIPEAARIIRDESPTRLSTVDRTLRGDIETIVLKAMAKEKERRYQSGAELAEDIRRHLAGEPIAARESSASELLRRSLRRYRGAVAAGTIIILSLAALATYASIQSTRNRALAISELAAREEESLARHQSEEQRRIATELNDQLRQQLRAGLIERGRAEGVAQNGPGAESVLWPEFLGDPDSRPAFWALWELSARFPCLWTTTISQQISAVAGSPDGRLIVVGTRLGGLHFLRAESGETEALVGVDPPSPAGGVIGLCFLDAGAVLSVHADGQARTWDLAGEPPTITSAWRTQSRPLAAAEFSRGHDSLATADVDGEIAVWSVPEGALLGRWKSAEAGVTAIAVDAVSGAVATGTAGGAVHLWPREPDAPSRTVGSHRGAVRSLAFSRDGAALYSLEQDRARIRWDLRGIDRPRVAMGGVDSRRLALDGTGGRLLVVHNIYVMVEELEQEERRTLAYPVNAFHDAAWVGDRVVTVERTGEVRLWESRPWPAMRTLGSHTNWAFGVAFHPDGHSLVSASGDASIAVWSYPGGERLATTLLPARTRARVAVYNADGSVIAAACSDRLVRLIDPVSGAQLAGLGPLGGEVYSVAFSPDQSRLAAAAGDGSITVFDFQTRSVVRQVSALGAVPRGLAYSPDGRTLYTTGAPDGVIIWDAETLVRRGLLPTTSEAWSVAVSPDGSTVGAGTFGATVEFFDLATGVRTIGAARHHLVAAGLAFSPDGTMLASGGDDGTVKLWEPASARLLASLDSTSGPIPGVGFSPDGSTLACATAGGAVEVWDLHHHDGHIARNLESAIARFRVEGTPSENLERLRAWAAGVIDGAAR